MSKPILRSDVPSELLRLKRSCGINGIRKTLEPLTLKDGIMPAKFVA
jgi:hypothetical protein